MGVKVSATAREAPTLTANNLTAKAPAAAGVKGSKTAAAQTKGQLTNAAHITITPLGFDSAEVVMPPAPFFILVENRSGVDGVTLRIDPVGFVPGGSIKLARRPREQLDWADLLKLAPGAYVLTEADQPDSSCRITVNAK